MDVLCCVKTDAASCTSDSGFWGLVSRGEYVRTVLKNYYAPFLMMTPVRVRSLRLLL